MQETAPPKILISRLSAVGDVVRTLPAVKAIREHFPKSEIHWLVEDRCSAILKGLAYVDELKEIPRKGWPNLSLVEKWQCGYQYTRSMRQEKYDIYLDFHGILKSGIYGFLFGIPLRIGYPAGLAKEGNTLFTNKKIHITSSHISRYERNFLFARHFDPNSIEERADLPLSNDDRKFAVDFLNLHCIKEKQYICLFPGSSEIGKFKRWPPALYGKLVDLLYQEFHLPSVICWGPGEEDLVSEVLKNSNQSPLVLPLVTLKELCAVVEKSSLFIGGDTGPMHMASMLGTPLVAIFGPSDPLINAPASFTPSSYVYAGVECSPCRNRSCKDLNCLKAITPEMILSAAKKILPCEDMRQQK